MKTKERRRHKRINKTIALNITAVKTRKKNEITTFPKIAHEVGLNLAEGGVLVECADSIPQNSQLSMTLLLPDTKPPEVISARGKIIWSKRTRRKNYTFHYYGIEFEEISKKDIKGIFKSKEEYQVRRVIKNT